MTKPEGLTIRSFRVGFELERRIHKVDRWRIPVPYGIPLRGLAYWAIALVATIVLSRVPLVGLVIGILPAPVRLVVLPVGIAYALTRVQIDGRPAHSGLAAWARFALSPSRVAALKPVAPAGTTVRLADATFAADESAARYRGAVLEGPARVLFRYPARGWSRAGGRTLHVRQLPGPALFAGKEVRLKSDQRMVVHG